MIVPLSPDWLAPLKPWLTEDREMDSQEQGVSVGRWWSVRTSVGGVVWTVMLPGCGVCGRTHPFQW